MNDTLPCLLCPPTLSLFRMRLWSCMANRRVPCLHPGLTWKPCWEWQPWARLASPSEPSSPRSDGRWRRRQWRWRLISPSPARHPSLRSSPFLTSSETSSVLECSWRHWCCPSGAQKSNWAYPKQPPFHSLLWKSLVYPSLPLSISPTRCTVWIEIRREGKGLKKVRHKENKHTHNHICVCVCPHKDVGSHIFIYVIEMKA